MLSRRVTSLVCDEFSKQLGKIDNSFFFFFLIPRELIKNLPRILINLHHKIDN